MSDFGNISIETSKGHRPPSPAGDRLLVALAAVALIGGLLLAVVNVMVDDDDALANASPTPTGRHTPLPSPTERPRMVFTVEPGVPEIGTSMDDSFSGWIRANADIALLTGPSATALQIGTLASDALAYADSWSDEGSIVSGWLHVVAPEPAGWFATPVNGTDLVERHAQNLVPGSANVWQVSAGDDGFVAVGTPPYTSDAFPAPRVYSSTDGRRWRASTAELFDPSYGFGEPAIAWGPAGWLLLALTNAGDGQPAAWIWQSADGVRWKPLGTMAGLMDFSYPSRLIGSKSGYLLGVDDRRGQGSSLFASRDGLTWRESEAPGFMGQSGIQIAPAASGFLAWDSASGTAHQEMLYSIDGRSWSATDGPESFGQETGGLQVTSFKDQVIAAAFVPEADGTQIWLGTADRRRLTWTHDDAADRAFRGTVVTSLVNDGLRAVAVGWEISTNRPLAWTLNSDGWRRSELPEAFRDGIPRLAAGGPTGIVLLAYRPTLRGPNPIFWHRIPGGGWQPEESPIFDVTPDRVGECGAPPANALDFSLVDRSMAVSCFGSTPITFRAWAQPCHGCYGSDSGRGPVWLQGGEPQLFLSPIESQNWGGTNAILDPSLGYDGAWVESWLEVTGHFDDPVAGDCTWVPGTDQFNYYDGQAGTINQCRLQFVVTAVTVVDGP